MAGMKYEQLLKRSGRIQIHMHEAFLYVFSEAYYIRSTKAKLDTGYAEVPKSEKWDGYWKYVISLENHIVSKYYFSKARKNTSEMERWLHSEKYFKNSLYWNSYFHICFTLIYEFFEYYDSISRYRAALKYKMIPLRY